MSFQVLALHKGSLADHVRAHLRVPLAVLLRVGFKAFLRPPAVGNLRRTSILLPRRGLGPRRSCVLLIESPGTRRVFGRPQFAMLRDGWALRWLAWIVSDIDLPRMLLPGGLQAVTSLMRELGEELHVAHLGLRPCSLRSGAGTELLEKDANIPGILHLGRWRCLAPLERYLQETVAFLVAQAISGQAANEVARYAALFEVFGRPPKRHWSKFFTRSHRPTSAIARAKTGLRKEGVSVPW